MARWWGGILLFALLICLTTVPAVAAQQTVLYACVNNSSGEAKLVSADTVCNRNWTQVQWNVTGPQGPQGEPGSPGAPGQSIAVIDTKGVQVGQFIGVSGQVALVVLEVSGFPITLNVFPNRLIGNAAVLSTTSDCSGPSSTFFTTPGYPPGTTLLPAAIVVPPNKTLIVADPKGTAQSIIYQATYAGGTCTPTGGSGYPVLGYPMMELVDLNTMFTPPFSLKLK